jgi:outer membrane autotransporter protein
VPFVGLYAAYSKGGFFADSMVRADFYQNSLSDSAAGYSGLGEDAHSLSFTGNVGYNIPLGGGWFIEPAGGVIWSQLHANSFVLPQWSGISANNTVQIDTIDSVLGRGGISVGTNITSGGVLWQPYVTVGVVHEFAGNVTATQSANVTVNGTPDQPVSLSSSIDRFGTYGQYTLGTAAVLGNTGWLGYGRIDYRKGDTIEGVSGNVGLRYQW